jgi:NADH dehydrogenase/NADH:ubiquinone oxidoreductase subunit G
VADVVLPAACAYEKNGTVTNVTGEVQRLTRAVNTMGAKPDLEIMGFLAREMGAAAALGPWTPEAVFEEMQKMPINAGIPAGNRPDLTHSDHNGLFASGTLGRYSRVLNSVVESRLDR